MEHLLLLMLAVGSRLVGVPGWAASSSAPLCVVRACAMRLICVASRLQKLSSRKLNVVTSVTVSLITEWAAKMTYYVLVESSRKTYGSTGNFLEVGDLCMVSVWR